jgi:hypothetical protein
VADHLSRMNRGQDDKVPIEDKMRDDHLIECSIKTLG